MSHLTTVQTRVGAGFAALKTALLEWNEYQTVAARSIFQQRVDPLTGGSPPQDLFCDRGCLAPMRTSEAATPPIQQESQQK